MIWNPNNLLKKIKQNKFTPLYMQLNSHVQGLSTSSSTAPQLSTAIDTCWPLRHHSLFLLFQTPYNRPTPPKYTPQLQSQAEEAPRGYGGQPCSSTDNPHMVWLAASQISHLRQLGLCNSCAENLNPDSDKYPEWASPTPEQSDWLIDWLIYIYIYIYIYI